MSSSFDELMREIREAKAALATANAELESAPDQASKNAISNRIGGIRFDLGALRSQLPKLGPSRRHHLRYKSDTSKIHARLFLDSVSSRLHQKFKFTTLLSSPSFGDVCYHPDSTANVGGKVTRLRDFYTDAEWEYLKEMHGFTRRTLHGNRLPDDPDDPHRKRVIFPTEFCGKLGPQIAAKTNVVFAPEDLVVLDAQVLSNGSDTSEDV